MRIFLIRILSFRLKSNFLLGETEESFEISAIKLKDTSALLGMTRKLYVFFSVNEKVEPTSGVLLTLIV